MKSVIEEAFIGLDMSPLPDDIWRGVRLLPLTEYHYYTTTSDTLATWSIPAEGAITTQGENRCNGIIRWYDPITGRWLSNDPIGISGGLNQYVFVENDPVGSIDPDGLARVKISTSGGQNTNVTDPSVDQFIQMLQGIADRGETIRNMEILGHGWNELQNINNTDYLDTGCDRNQNKIIRVGGRDITALLRSVANGQTTIDLQGCRTGRGDNSIAHDLSQLLPDTSVSGSRNFTLSPYEIYHWRTGIPLRIRTWKTYRNGQ